MEGVDDLADIERRLAAVTHQWRTRVFGLPDAGPEPEPNPMEARPLAEGLRNIASNPAPPGEAYLNLMVWARHRGYFGYDSAYESQDDLLGSWLPKWRKGLYVSTSITSGGAALDPTLSASQVVAQNTMLAEQLTNQIAADHNFDPRDVLLSTDLPYVKGWKQSDYLIFWLMCLDGIPLDICKPFAARMQNYAKKIGMDSKHLPYDEKWERYQQVVEEFWQLADRFAIHGRNDYYWQTARIKKLVQLVDTERSLGCRAEAMYARKLHTEVLSLQLCPEALEPDLRERVGRLAAMGAKIGLPHQATQLVST